MSARVVDLNADVTAIRRLRAAAVLPQFAALCCVVFAVLFVGVGIAGWKTMAVLSGIAAVLIATAHAVERGAAWAVGWLPSRHREPAEAVHRLSRGAWSRTPRAQRSREATVSFAIAVAIYVAGIVPVLLAAVAVGGHLWICGIVYAPIAAAAGRLWNRGRRQSALRLQEIRRLDARPPVILLRSFDDDDMPLEKRYHLFWFLFTARETLTLESFVVDQVWRLGPVIAIGKPGERLSPLGAAREYGPDERWRSSIHTYINDARYAVSVLGATPGLRWEYEQLQALGKTRDVLVVFPPHQPDELQRRWSVLQGIFAPARDIVIQWEPFIGVPVLAFFGSDGVTILYCKYRHETAYAAAFSRLFALLAHSI